MSENPDVPRCEICNGAEFAEVPGTVAGTYYRCLGCGLELQRTTFSSYAHEKFESQQSVLFAADSSFLRPLARWMHHRKAVHRIRTLKSFLPQGKVLEVGPGSGATLSEALRQQYEVEAVEHSHTLAQQIMKSQGIHVHIGEFERLDLEQSHYDACVSFHVIEHVTDPLRHVAQAAKIVKPGGLLIIATPNVQCWQHSLSRGAGPCYSNGHLRLFSPEAMRMALEKAGWHVIRVSTNEDVGWLRVATRLWYRLRNRRARTYQAGTSMKRTHSRFGFTVVWSYLALSWPLRVLQSIFGGGIELVVVARRPPSQRTQERRCGVGVAKPLRGAVQQSVESKVARSPVSA